MLSLFTELPRYWMQGVCESLQGLRRGCSEPYPIDEDPSPTTPYTVIYEEGKVRLRYYPPVGRPHPTPLVLVYALIKRPFILDLLPGRSVVESLTRQGFSLYLLDWIPPTRADAARGFDAYVNGDVANAVRAVQQRAGVERVSLFGYCFGGLLAALYTALYPQTVQHLLTLTLPLDLRVQQAPLFTFLVNHVDEQTINLLLSLYGNCPAWLVHAGFTAMAPVHHSVDKYVALYRNQEKAGYSKMFALVERWMQSDVPLAGQLFREAVTEIFQRNLLVHDQFRIGGQLVHLRRITCPVLNIIGEHDDVVPPASSRAFADLTGSADAHTLLFPAGHIGVVVSSLAQQRLWPRVAAWLWERAASQ